MREDKFSSGDEMIETEGDHSALRHCLVHVTDMRGRGVSVLLADPLQHQKFLWTALPI